MKNLRRTNVRIDLKSLREGMYDVSKLLDPCPDVGEGVHYARHGAINRLALLGYSPDEIRILINDWGPPEPAKVEDSLRKIFADGDPRLNFDEEAFISSPKTVVDYDKVVRLYRDYGGYRELLSFLGTTEAVKATKTRDWLRQMYHPDDYLCLGANREDTEVKPLRTWLGLIRLNFLGAATKYCWLTPNPFKPEASGRCNDGIAGRRYYVLEADIADFNKAGNPTAWEPYLKAEGANGWDFQAGIIRHLFERNYPIVSIVHSGNKSLHVWCASRLPEEVILGVIRYGANLGMDDRGKVLSQFMRLPNPDHPTRRQPLLYFNPDFVNKPS
jgi:hypothetical protein